MTQTFVNPMTANSGLIIHRKPQQVDVLKLPKDLRVVSADNHIELTQDIFYERFPARLRDAAPRVWFDKYWRVGFKEKQHPGGVDLDAVFAKTFLNDGFDLKIRHEHLDAEGIAQEIVYPQSLLGFVRHPDQEMQELIYRTYNEYIAELAKQNPGRFYGVAICSNWWNPSKAEAAIRQIVDLGFKTFMLPRSPGMNVHGKPIDYAGIEMNRLWSVAEDAGLPVNFHVGEFPSSGGGGGYGTFFVVTIAPFRQVFGNLIFGGILDRHPKLQIVFAEGGINWVAGALQDAELTYGAHREIYPWPMKHRPTHYWHNNMYATFQTDEIGLKLLDYIGANRVLWAQDYPHSEGTFGYSTDAMQEVLKATSQTDARKILGDTARALYKLN